MQTYFARQPILDQDMRLSAYELLYRGGPQTDNAGFPFLDENKATAAVMEAIQMRGLDKITGGNTAYVNFPGKLLLDGVAAFFPPKGLVIEILENVEPTEAIMKELRHLRKLGYKLALDDFTYRPELKAFLRIADVVKIDFLESAFSMKNFYAICSHINLAKCVLLAEKVETLKVYKKARELGCQLFQGYFFAKPATLSERTIGVMHVNALRLMSEASKKEIDFAAVSEIVKEDVGLTFRILKLVNSAYFSLVRAISDIKQAVVFLGQNEIKKWVSFVALTNMNDRKPPELIEMSMVRARFCETAAQSLGHRNHLEAYFLTGLFSLLDVMIDARLEVIIGDLMLPDITKDALTGADTEARHLLSLIIALERGKWDEALKLCEKLNVNSGEMSELYADALQWSGELHTQMHG